MRLHRARTATLAIVLAALTSLIPAGRAGAQNDNSISVDDFANGQRGNSLTATVPIRRGVTTKVTIVKDFIDLVSFNNVTLSGGGTLSGKANGRTRNGAGMGFLSVNITVPPGQTAGSTITLNVGSQDHFTFKTVHRGEIASVTKSAEPETLLTGTPWTTTIQGTDIGDLIVAPIDCHTITYSGRTANAVTARLTHNGSCTTSAFGVALRGSTGDDPPSYNLAAGPLTGFQFKYAIGGLACVNQPGIGQPNVRQPLNNQVITFNSGQPSPANVTIRWDSATVNSIAAPNNEWVVQRLVPRGTTSTSLSSTTVKGLSTTIAFAVPGTHTVTVRAKNCGESAPGTSVTFTTKY